MKKRLMAICCAAILLVASFTGCGGSASNNQTGGDATPIPAADNNTPADGEETAAEGPGWMKDTSPVTLTWWLDANWYTGTWGESLVSKYVTEKTGVTIEFQVPTGDPNEALTLLMAGGGEMPDMLSVGFWESSFKKLQDNGFAQPLNKLAEAHDPYFFEVVDPALLNWNRRDDGNVYVLPNEAYTENGMRETGATNANQTFLVRKDLYEDMGKPDMRTPEGFLGALQKLKDEFAVYKGETMLPFYAQGAGATGCYGLQGILLNFLAVPFEKDNKIYDRYIDPDYIRWLKTFREGVSRGLITMDFFVDTNPQTTEKMNNARYFSIINEWHGVQEANTFLYNTMPEAVYLAIDGPSNANLDPAKIFPGSMNGWLPVMISKDCKTPDRAIRFMSYWASEEGQKDIFLGRKGETWDTIDGKEQFLPEVMDLLNSDSNEFSTKIGAGDSYWMLRDPCMVAKWRAPKIEPIAQNEEWARQHADYAGGIYISLDPESDSEEGIINSQINLAWGQLLPMLLNAASEQEFDTLWDGFISQREALGFEKLQAYRQKELDKFKAKLAQ